MTPGPAPALYVKSVLRYYLDLPDTPQRPRSHDRRVARELMDRAVPLALVEAALLLADARRRARPPNASPLEPIRSLSYFLPVIEELRQQTPADGYFEYLRARRRPMLRMPQPANGSRPENDVSS